MTYIWKRKVISMVVLAALVVTSVLSPGVHSKAIAVGEKIEGAYGEGISYSYYKDSLGIKDTACLSGLILEGSGAMMDTVEDQASRYEKQPWFVETLDGPSDDPSNELPANIREILIGGNITSLGEYGFYYYNSEKIMRLGSSVKTLPKACLGNTRFEDIYIYGELETVATDAFLRVKSGSTTRIHVVSEESKVKITAAFPGNANNVIVDLKEDETPLWIAVRKGLIEQKIIGENSDKYTTSSWSALTDAVTDGKAALEAGNPTKEIIDGKAAAINTALQGLVSLEGLKEAIEKINELEEDNYTEATWAALQTAVQAGNEVNIDNATLEQVNTLTQGIEKAIEGLVPVSPEDALEELGQVVNEAKGLVESDYKKATWTELQKELAKVDTITPDNTPEIKAVTKAITEALKKLEIDYPDLPPLAGIRRNVETTIVSGVADEAMAGAVKAVITFDCTSEVSYNQYASIDFMYTIGGKSAAIQFPGTGDYTTGRKGFSETLEIDEVTAGEKYSISGTTFSWDSVVGDIYLIQSVAFYDVEDQLLKKVTSLPTNELKTLLNDAEEKVDGLVEGDYTKESVTLLESAIESAKVIIAQDFPLPSAIAKVTADLETALNGLTATDTTEIKTTLSSTVSQAKELIKDHYTAESWSVLEKALLNADKELDTLHLSEITALNQAIVDAIGALIAVDPPTSSPDLPSDSPTPPVQSPSPVPSAQVPTPVPTTGNSDQLGVVKKASVKKVTAKKSVLTVKIKKKVKGITTYQVVAAKKNNFKKSTKVTVKNVKKLTIAIPYKKLKLKKGSKYYIKIRSVKKINKKNKYSKYSNVKRITIK